MKSAPCLNCSRITLTNSDPPFAPLAFDRTCGWGIQLSLLQQFVPLAQVFRRVQRFCHPQYPADAPHEARSDEAMESGPERRTAQSPRESEKLMRKRSSVSS